VRTPAAVGAAKSPREGDAGTKSPREGDAGTKSLREGDAGMKSPVLESEKAT
jgi:hypothetical protein